jgi:hypothetical protein
VGEERTRPRRPPTGCVFCFHVGSTAHKAGEGPVQLSREKGLLSFLFFFFFLLLSFLVSNYSTQRSFDNHHIIIHNYIDGTHYQLWINFSQLSTRHVIRLHHPLTSHLRKEHLTTKHASIHLIHHVIHWTINLCLPLIFCD